MTETTLMDKIWFNSEVTLPLKVFEIMEKYHISFEKLKEIEKTYEGARNNLLGYNLGNTFVRYSYKDKVFSIGMYAGKNGTRIHMWDQHGIVSLGEYVEEHDVPSEDMVKWLYESADNYILNKIRCSDCGTIINKCDIAGSYFAGRYCKHCWETKWKAIEAKETYD